MTTADPFEREQTLALPRTTLHVFEAGAGPPVVLLHGNPDTHHMWRGVVDVLRAKHRCIAPDLPGYGASTMQEDLSLDAQADVVESLLDALSLPRVHLVVHDVGGSYGLAFAARSPARLSALTIFNTNFFVDYHWHFWARMWRTPLVGEVVMALGFEGLFVRELKQGAPAMTDAHARETYRRYTSATRANVLRYYRYMDSERYVGWTDKLLAAIKDVPRQVCWGDLDPYISSSIADRFGGDVHHFPNIGHFAMVEDPTRMAALIAALDARAPR